ncbi:BON domain-containing protein [Paraburkholderia sp. J7]|uniref:BON domain-containing protein n=1 Tax=Paraburkholderia sp. J7 TaxID=2805438 RepID=UPI002AB5EC14|nr:BON domain-containing protein [Paraburkholderia sp. J7]
MNIALTRTTKSKLELTSVIKSTVVVFVLTLAMGAQAQEAASAVDPTTAAAPASLKAQKAANHALVKKVRYVLARTKGLSPANIYVKAVDGSITLTGNCVSDDQVALAGYATQRVEGVTSVNNRLVIRTPR